MAAGPFAAGYRERASAASAHPLHPGAWLAWLLCGSVAAVLTSNPLYLGVAFLASGGVYLAVRDTPKGRALQPFVVIGLLLALLTLPLNVLTGSSGETVLVTVREIRSPEWFGGVIFGGTITAEALITATSRALSIATLVLLAAAFNASVDHFRLMKMAPRSLARLMLVLTIALLVVPQAVEHARAVAEAHRLRGRRAGGLRGVARLFLPTLQGALERSVQRAESMDARGFAGGTGARHGDILASLVGVAGVGLCGWGSFAHFYYGGGPVPAGLMLAGAALVALALLGGRDGRSSRFHRQRWTAVDVAVAAAALLSVALVLGMRIFDVGEAAYFGYPEISAPVFHPFGAIAFALFLAPAVPALLGPPDADTTA